VQKYEPSVKMIVHIFKNQSLPDDFEFKRSFLLLGREENTI